MRVCVLALLVCIESTPPAPGCQRFQFPSPENGLDALFSAGPISERILANLDVHSMFKLMEAAQKDSIYLETERALKRKLMPPSGDITWFDTPDAAHALQDPPKIQQFLEHVGALYPTFFRSLDLFDAGVGPHRQGQIRAHAKDAPRMWDFLSRLSRIPDVQYEVVLFFNYFAPGMRHRSSYILTMEDAYAHSIWPKFDGPIGGYSDLNVLYAWFPDHKVRPEHRADVFNALDWLSIYIRMVLPKIDRTSQFALRSLDPLKIEGNEYVFLTTPHRRNGLPSSWLIEHSLLSNDNALE